jgi:uncharacterized membrane protein YecN with MAPEG domain
MSLPVTILYGSLSILVTVVLALNISLHRLRHHVHLTDPVPDALHRKVRAHGNSIEWLPATILLLAFLELQHVPSMWLHLLGGLVLVARILHSLFMLGRSRFSTFSATATYTVSFVMAFWSLYLRLLA